MITWDRDMTNNYVFKATWKCPAQRVNDLITSCCALSHVSSAKVKHVSPEVQQGQYGIISDDLR